MSDSIDLAGDPPRRHLGIEVGTGASVELTLNENGMRANFLGGSGHLQRRSGFNSIVQLDDGEVATLLDCVRLSLGRPGSPQDGPWLTQTIPNTVILGEDAWPEEGRIRQFRCRFTHSNTALHYTEHLDHDDGAEPAASQIPTFIPPHVDPKKLVILQVNSRGYRVVCELSMSGQLSRFEPSLVFAPVLRIESNVPRDLAEIHRFAAQVITFFEMSLGVRSRMFDIRVSEQSFETQETILARGEGIPVFYKVRLYYGTCSRADDPLHPFHTLFPVIDAESRKRTEEALTQWLDRLPVWEATYALASFYLGRTGTFDRDRLLRAASWFESLPSRETKSDATEEQLAAIKAAATAAALASGRPDLAPRIEGLISNLAVKSLRNQMLDHAALLREHFGEQLLPKSLDAAIATAASLRSQASHGGIAFGDDDAERTISATTALELVCLLATVFGLLNPETAKKRLSGHHPLARHLFGG